MTASRVPVRMRAGGALRRPPGPRLPVGAPLKIGLRQKWLTSAPPPGRRAANLPLWAPDEARSGTRCGWIGAVGSSRSTSQSTA